MSISLVTVIKFFDAVTDSNPDCILHSTCLRGGGGLHYLTVQQSPRGSISTTLCRTLMLCHLPTNATTNYPTTLKDNLSNPA